MGAQFEPLYDDDKKALGEELVTTDQFRLVPGDAPRTIEVAFAADAQFLGVLAAFRAIGNPTTTWKAVVRVPSESLERGRRRYQGHVVRDRIRGDMSAHNKVVWSEGLFLQPQHFQQQDRLLRAVRRVTLPGAGARTAGDSPSSRSNGPAGHRQARRCAARPACSPTARLSACRTTIRCPLRSTSARRCRIRSCTWPCRCAGRPAGRRDRRRGGRRVGPPRPPRSEARDVASTSPEPAMLERGARCGRGSCCAERPDRSLRVHPAGARRRVPGRQAGGAGRGFMPTVLRARRRPRLAAFTARARRACCTSEARRWAGRASATAASAAAQIAGLPDAAGHQPLRAAADALQPSPAPMHPEALYRVFVAMAGELATLHAQRPGAPDVARLPARAAARVVRAGDGAARRGAQRGPRAERDPHPDRAAAARHLRGRGAGPRAVLELRCSCWPPRPTCRPRICAGGFRPS